MWVEDYIQMRLRVYAIHSSISDDLYTLKIPMGSASREQSRAVNWRRQD
jgi:hypothetical protein